MGSPPSWRERLRVGLGLRREGREGRESGDAAQQPQRSRPAAAGTDGAPSARSSAQAEALRHALGALARRLDAHERARDVAPHLSALEGALSQHGAGGVSRLPTALLERAQRQLLRLFGERPQDDLEPLRRLLTEVLARRQPAQAAALQVSEASVSQFDEAERSWGGQVPASLRPGAGPAEPR